MEKCSEEKKKYLLRQGIFLDQMHFDCVAAKEDVEKKLTFQCFKCKAWGQHKTWECRNETKYRWNTASEYKEFVLYGYFKSYHVYRYIELNEV